MDTGIVLYWLVGQVENEIIQIIITEYAIDDKMELTAFSKDKLPLGDGNKRRVMIKEFEVIDHTADIGVTAYGRDLPQTFANAARGMFDLITDIDKINENMMMDVSVTAPDREALLVNWLNELIYLFDTEMVLFNRFQINTLTDTELKAQCYGEKINKSRHELKRGIKSATYHMLKIDELESGGYKASVLVDV